MKLAPHIKNVGLIQPEHLLSDEIALPLEERVEWGVERRACGGKRVEQSE